MFDCEYGRSRKSELVLRESRLLKRAASAATTAAARQRRRDVRYLCGGPNARPKNNFCRDDDDCRAESILNGTKGCGEERGSGRGFPTAPPLRTSQEWNHLPGSVAGIKDDSKFGAAISDIITPGHN
ncbi:hypothetical protein HPB50_025461 [Hyalomma asiaticum]|uniref:Uncharacterized protein n=1 Tax=Hyalomma asiaticum TaxID=266040 RepID=A0ACB7SBW7_HYAAI|nr:hypothetical protein HPB50_025461 [Hyalomma asiaticum]